MNPGGGAGLLDRIRELRPRLRPAERRVADYVLSDRGVIYRSITEVAEASGAGYGTIVRYCRRLGCSGFHDFKIRLALESSGTGAQRRARRGEGGLLEAAAQAAEALRAAAEGVQPRALKAAARAVARARRILAVGYAGSYPTALDLAYRLSRLGLEAAAEPDGHMQAIRASSLRPGDVLLAVSFSGSTKGILTAAEVARGARAKVIALTNYALSPLAETSDYVLTTSARTGVLEAEVVSRIPAQFVAESLFEEVFKLVPKAGQHLKATSRSVSNKLL